MRRFASLSALGGVALLVSLFLPWFDVTEAGWFTYSPLDGSGVVDEPAPDVALPSLTGWEAFSRLDVLLALLAVPAIAALVSRGAAKLAAVTGWIAVAVVAIALGVSALTPDVGAWIALAGALAAWGGSWLAAFGHPPRPRVRRLRRAEPLAGGGGLLLLVSLFLPWYGAEPQPEPPEDVLGLLYTFTGDAALTAWESFELLPVALMVVAVLALAVPVGPIRAAVVASAFGWVAIALVGYALIARPDDWPDLRYGVWLALLGAVGAWVGSWLSLRDESTPGATAPDVPRRPAPA